MTSFELVATDGAARAGRLTTGHGAVETPVFMPVGTRGTVKSLGPDDLRAAGAQILPERRIDVAGRDRVHAHLICRLVDGERFRERRDRAFKRSPNWTRRWEANSSASR